jgi:hypothetical protein
MSELGKFLVMRSQPAVARLYSAMRSEEVVVVLPK